MLEFTLTYGDRVAIAAHEISAVVEQSQQDRTCLVMRNGTDHYVVAGNYSDILKRVRKENYGV